MCQRRILAQGNFLKQKPSEANLTINALKEMLHFQSYDSLMSKLMHCATNVSGTNAYWNCAKDYLKVIITQVGTPTIFWTLSCAEVHWPEFHNFFSSNGETSDSEHRADVINNPHLLDCFLLSAQNNLWIIGWKKRLVQHGIGLGMNMLYNVVKFIVME